jgi:hypothetical protein
MSQSGEPFDPYHQWLGIPPEEQPPNHYRLLGIQLFEQNREVIQNTADRQMAHLRSFQSGPRAAQSQKLLNEVAAAKLCLLSPDKKAAYDAAWTRPYADASEVAPPMPTEPPAEPSVNIVFGGTPGTLPTAPSRRALPASRPRRRSGLLPWLLVFVAVVLATLLGWYGWRDRFRSERLILIWPAAERQDGSLKIDGRTFDLVRDPVVRGVEELEFDLLLGSHRVQIVRPGYEPIEESIELTGGTPARIAVTFAPASSTKSGKRDAPATTPTVGRIVLRWPAAARKGASLKIDGHTADLTRPAITDNPDTVEVTLRPGPHSLRIVLADGQTQDRSFTLEPGQRWELDVAGSSTPTAARIVLQWPAADREGATLEIDGQPREIAADSAGVDAEQIAVDVEPGKHTVRIVRPGFNEFRAEWAGVQAEERLAVTWDRSARARPSAPELQRLREEFQKKYQQFEEYQKWVAEKDVAKQSELLRFLLPKLELEAGKLPGQSAEQWAACDEAIRLALTGQEFVQARKMLTGAVGGSLFSDAERQAREDQIWEEALKSVRVDSLADYLKLRKSDGRVLTEQEQAVVVQRMSEAAGTGTDYTEIVARVQELQDQAVLTKDAAVRARVAVYIQAAGGEFANPGQALDLSERMLAAVPLLFESGLDDAPQRVDALVDAVSVIRRQTLKEAGAVDEVRLRMGRLTENIKVVRDWASQFARVRTARKTIADGQAIAAERKLVAFWLLQLGQFPEALPHLRNAGDEALANIARPIPETAKELALLADEVEQESKKSKYSRRQEDALRAYVHYLRQTALDKKDSSLQPAERTELQKKLSAAETERSESYSRRFPKEKWCNLTDVASVDELRERIDGTGSGQWTLLGDGSIATNGKGTPRLELPVVVDGSYGVRFVCRRVSGDDVNVHLPLGETSVVLTLGGAKGCSGFQLVDGRGVADALNPARMTRTDFPFENGVPVAVEIQVDIMKAETQNAKLRKQTEGRDWVTLRVVVSGKKAPVVRSVSLAVSAFAPPKDLDLPSTVLGLSTRAEAVYANLRLIRQ